MSTKEGPQESNIQTLRQVLEPKIISGPERSGFNLEKRVVHGGRWVPNPESDVKSSRIKGRYICDAVVDTDLGDLNTKYYSTTDYLLSDELDGQVKSTTTRFKIRTDNGITHPELLTQPNPYSLGNSLGLFGRVETVSNETTGMKENVLIYWAAKEPEQPSQAPL